MHTQPKDWPKGRVSLNGYIYSITSTTNKRAPVFLDFYFARALVQSLRVSDNEQATTTIGFVVMPDHFHWLFELRDKYELSDAIGRVKGRAALTVNKRRNSIHKIWQPGFHDKCIRKEEDIMSVMRYIAANPLRAGLVNSLAQYSHWDCIYV
jgi:REP element-mobilizing transposase RayT